MKRISEVNKDRKKQKDKPTRVITIYKTVTAWTCMEYDEKTDKMARLPLPWVPIFAPTVCEIAGKPYYSGVWGSQIEVDL